MGSLGTWTRATPLMSRTRAIHLSPLIRFPSIDTEKRAVVRIFSWYVTYEYKSSFCY